MYYEIQRLQRTEVLYIMSHLGKHVIIITIIIIDMNLLGVFAMHMIHQIWMLVDLLLMVITVTPKKVIIIQHIIIKQILNSFHR